MSERPDRDLDRLFQQGTRRYDFEYDTEAWRDMEQLLDRDEQRRRRVLLWWWILAGLLVVLALIFGLSRHDEERQQRPAPIVAVGPGSPGDDASSSAPDEEGGSRPHQPAASARTAKPMAEAPAGEKATEPTPPATPPLAPSMPVHQTPETPPVLPAAENTSLAGESQKSQITRLSSEAKAEAPALPAALEGRQVQVHAPAYGHFTPPAINLPARPARAIPGRNALTAGLHLAPEWSFTRLSDPSGVNRKAGLQLEYRFARRFSAAVGVAYSRKDYGAEGDDYRPPKGFWYYDEAPDYTQASCYIVEVPLLAGFYPRGHVRSGLFAQAGMTSVFMREEHYWYLYKEAKPDQITYWGGENENRHWFAIAQFGVGYQLALGRRSLLQLIPSAQIPIGGIGHGQVRLYSFGIGLGYHYRFH